MCCGFGFVLQVFSASWFQDIGGRSERVEVPDRGCFCVSEHGFPGGGLKKAQGCKSANPFRDLSIAVSVQSCQSGFIIGMSSSLVSECSPTTESGSLKVSPSSGSEVCLFAVNGVSSRGARESRSKWTREPR